MEYLFGAGLQFLRQFKNFSEWWVPLYVIAACALAVFLSDAVYHNAREFLRAMGPDVVKLLATTQATSTGANLVMSAKPKLAGNLFVPVTDSM